MKYVKDIATLKPGQAVTIESTTPSSGREYKQKLYFASLNGTVAAFDKSKAWALKDLGSVFVDTRTRTITAGNRGAHVRHNAMIYTSDNA